MSAVTACSISHSNCATTASRVSEKMGLGFVPKSAILRAMRKASCLVVGTRPL